MEGLILHCGAEKMTRGELRHLATPPATRTWRPVPHCEAADIVAAEAERRGYRILKEEYGTTPGGNRMFGVLRFHPEDRPDYSRALGIRNSHDKSLALGLVVGASVVCCDNLSFGGSLVIHRKHTSGIVVEELVSGAFDRLTEEFEKLDANIGRLKGEGIDADGARLEVVKAAETGAIPSCDILPVLKEFREPRHVDFGEPTRWSLYNSFTETAKKYSPARADQCYRRLAKLFGLD